LEEIMDSLTKIENGLRVCKPSEVGAVWDSTSLKNILGITLLEAGFSYVSNYTYIHKRDPKFIVCLESSPLREVLFYVSKGGREGKFYYKCGHDRYEYVRDVLDSLRKFWDEA
jgi:hypothetical protein